MIEKRIEYPGVDDRGDVLVRAILPRLSHVKFARAEYLQGLHPTIRAFIEKVRPHPRRLFVLTTAVSAGQFYGNNLNGDSFSEASLKAKGRGKSAYGHETFLDAGIYLHHKNTDKGKSLGEIPLSVYHDYMHRVELILDIDRDKAAQEKDSQDVVEQLDSEKNPPTSIGCRVPFDVCEWCGNIAPTRVQYCEHALQYMNHLADAALIETLRLNRPEWVRQRRMLREKYGDLCPIAEYIEPGSRMGVINVFPNFFDESVVAIGAERVAFALLKVAMAMSGNNNPLSADVAQLYLQFEKQAKQRKLSQILKEIPGYAPQMMAALQDTEEDLPPGLLDLLATGGIQRALATLTGTGIVLCPHEFQRLMLLTQGQRPLADEIDAVNGVFAPSAGQVSFGIPYGPEHMSDFLMPHVLPMMPERSALSPMLTRRVQILIQFQPGPQQTERVKISHPQLKKVAAAYTGYLEALPERLSKLAVVSCERLDVRGWLQPGTKIAGLRERLAVLGLFPLTYIYARSLRNRREQGEQLGTLQQFVANHPIITGSMLAGGSEALRRML